MFYSLLSDTAAWTETAQDELSAVFLWSFLALAVLLLAVGLLVWFKKKDALRSYVTAALSLAVGASVMIIICMLSLQFFEMVGEGYVFGLVLYPAAVLGGTVVLGAAAIYICYLFGEKAFRIGKIAAAGVMGAALVAFLICLAVYYATGDAEINNGAEITAGENAGLYISAALLVAFLIFCALFFGKTDKSGFNTRSIAYAAICIAMSFALSYIAPIHMPQGGSVTIASLLPIMIYSYMFGVKKGIFVGMIYGILQAVQDPWIIHPAQFLLDYPIAFAGIGMAGVFARFRKLEKLPQVQFLLGGIVAGCLRYLAHILSGVFAFSEFAFHWVTGEAMDPWLYSLAYNSFVFLDIALAIAVGVLVFCSKTFVKEARKFHPKENAESAAESVSEN